MYQPYPGATEMPAVQRPPAPAPVRSAVVIMYAGAAVSLIRVIADLATRSSLKADMEKASGSPRTSPPWPRLCTVLVWLAGLGAVVPLWQRSSRDFFNGRQP